MPSKPTQPTALSQPTHSAPSSPMAIRILDPGDVLLAAYDQLTRHRLHTDAQDSVARNSYVHGAAPPAGSTAVRAIAPSATPHARLCHEYVLAEHVAFRPIEVMLHVTNLTVTVHATLPCFYGENPLVGLDSHSLVILTRDLPSGHRPPSPCAFATIHLPVEVDPARCAAAFERGRLGIRMLRVDVHAPFHSYSTNPSLTSAACS